MANMFDENGNYNKTEWKPGDRITAGKLNKIEESLEAINNNDIERHKEADERLDALEEQKEAVEERFDELEDLVADNKSEVDTAIYEVRSKMDRLEQEMNDGIDTVEAIAHTVDDKIADADASMKAQVAEAEDIVDQGKADINAIIDEVEKISDLEAINTQLTHNTLELNNNKNNNRLNIKDYGAIGDWASHPASEFYSSLEQLQKEYPKAQSLNDEMDTLALEKALTSSYKTIYIPYGGYKLNRAGFSISENRNIIGDGKTATQISYTGSGDTHVFKLTGNNILIKDFKLSGTFVVDIKGSDSITKAIDASGKRHNTFSDLFIVGFDYGIHFGTDAWVQYLKNIRIQNCNYGIYGNSEFNNICIDQCNITYCIEGVYAGGGRNIVIQMSDIERNERAIFKFNNGDIVIRDNYFELNAVANIQIAWSMSSVDMALIEGNSFFTSGDGEPMILYHTSPDGLIIIRNNNFCSFNVTEGVKIPCLKQTNNTLVRPIFKHNRLSEGYIIGVSALQINQDDYYQNGKHCTFSNNGTDLSTQLTSTIQTLRLPFSKDAIITLPSFNTFDDPSQCFKIFTYTGSNSNHTDADYMLIDSTGKIILGTTRIYPNQMYSIYFNRMSGTLEEILIVKG